MRGNLFFDHPSQLWPHHVNSTGGGIIYGEMKCSGETKYILPYLLGGRLFVVGKEKWAEFRKLWKKKKKTCIMHEQESMIRPFFFFFLIWIPCDKKKTLPLTNLPHVYSWKKWDKFGKIQTLFVSKQRGFSQSDDGASKKRTHLFLSLLLFL